MATSANLPTTPYYKEPRNFNIINFAASMDNLHAKAKGKGKAIQKYPLPSKSETTTQMTPEAKAAAHTKLNSLNDQIYYLDQALEQLKRAPMIIHTGAYLDNIKKIRDLTGRRQNAMKEYEELFAMLRKEVESGEVRNQEDPIAEALATTSKIDAAVEEPKNQEQPATQKFGGFAASTKVDSAAEELKYQESIHLSFQSLTTTQKTNLSLPSIHTPPTTPIPNSLDSKNPHPPTTKIQIPTRNPVFTSQRS